MEGVVGDRRSVGDDPDRFDFPSLGAIGHGDDFVVAALLDRNLAQPAKHRKIDRLRRQR
jgi:hypothetical protein